MNIESNSDSTNIWEYKPWWCQPWSIILTGVAIPIVSWLFLHILWVTVGISLLIIVWWIYFLLYYPQVFAEYLTSQKAESNQNK